MPHSAPSPQPDPGNLASALRPAAGSKNAGRQNSNHLLALGSAAVLAIYAAGYFRTRAADEKFGAGGTGGRHPSPAAAETPAVALTVDAAVIPPSAVTLPPVTPTAELKPSPAQQPAVEALPAPTTPAATVAAVTSTPDQTTSAQTAQNTVTAPAPTPAPAANPTVGTVAAAPVVAATAPVVAAPAPLPKWKDGKFSGWGYCRHGTIQATIEIKDGRIISAAITDCRTRYSCDVIAHLVPQVVARQSPEIDTVSGATQSADAFYGAITTALASAKPEPVKAL